MKKDLISPFESRQYMLQKDFELYYYNDIHMQPVADHTHDYYEFYFYLEGKVSINIDGMGHVLRSGDIVVIPPETVHHMDILNPNVPYRRFVFWVSTDFMDHLRERTPDYAYISDRAGDGHFITNFDPAAFSAFENRIYRLLEEIHARRFGRDEYILLAVDELILALSRAAYMKDSPAGKTEAMTILTPSSSWSHTSRRQTLWLPTWSLRLEPNHTPDTLAFPLRLRLPKRQRTPA